MTPKDDVCVCRRGRSGREHACNDGFFAQVLRESGDMFGRSGSTLASAGEAATPSMPLIMAFEQKVSKKVRKCA